MSNSYSLNAVTKLIQWRDGQPLTLPTADNWKISACNLYKSATHTVRHLLRDIATGVALPFLTLASAIEVAASGTWEVMTLLAMHGTKCCLSERRKQSMVRVNGNAIKWFGDSLGAFFQTLSYSWNNARLPLTALATPQNRVITV